MRRSTFALSHTESHHLLSQSKWATVALLNAQGHPQLKTMHVIWLDGIAYMHGSPKGERAESPDGAAQLQVEDVVASIPSYFTHPERACPATTFYRSVQVRGQLARVHDIARKAQVLNVLMTYNQPEGGYRPINHADRMYTNAIEQLDVLSMTPTEVVGKAKLGQQLKVEAAQRLLDNLWRRGQSGDLRAMSLIVDHHPQALTLYPVELSKIPNARVVFCPDQTQRHQIAELCATGYWRTGEAFSEIMGSWQNSDATVAIFDNDVLIGCARAVSDWHQQAWIYDVIVAPQWQCHGVGGRLMSIMLDHPTVRGCPRVLLGTRDAQAFYHTLGFEIIEPAQRGISHMMLSR